MTEFRSDALIRSDTSCNEIIVENRVDSNEISGRGLSDKSNSVPLEGWVMVIV